MSAFAQTPSGDLDISTGNLRVEKSVGQFTAWKLANLFGFFRGEWFVDARLGLPYVQYVLVSNPSLNRIQSIFQQVILDAPGVGSITGMSLDFLINQRRLDFSFAALANDGSLITGGPGKPFIVTTPPGTGA